jgi:uncharacterized membrane protein YcaP (DUF421 family)
MFTAFLAFADRLLGLHVQAPDLTAGQMAARAVVVFIFAVMLTRVADRRFLGRNAGYDWMLGVVLGSVLSRGINGQASFWPTLGASAILVILHHLLSKAAYRWHWFSVAVKGGPTVLIRNGQLNRDAMHRNAITVDDLDENLRSNGNETIDGAVREARLERNGSISVVHAEKQRPG